MSQPRVWFITGASSGFGRCLTEHVLSRGEIAVATLRSPSALDILKAKYTSEQLLILKCDVSIPADIVSAFSNMGDKFGRCDVVFNNAGFCVLGEVEGTSEDVARKLFDVNFWGALNVNREAVRFFREINPKGAGGVLLVNSSLAGFEGRVGLGYYSGSKHALEGVTEALRAKSCMEHSGAFATNASTNIITTPVHPAYADESLRSRIVRKYIAVGKFNGDPNKAAVRIIEFVDASQKGEDLPFRWALGAEIIELMKPKIASIIEDLKKSEVWSKNLMLDDP